MLFRRRLNDQEPRADLRRHHRHSPARGHALRVRLLRGDGPIAGDLIDLSASGVGVLFPWDEDPELKPGEEVELAFGSLVNGGEVRATARVASARDQEEPVGHRYGFEFTDPETLFAQLEAHDFRLFSRRRALRIRPAPERRPCAVLAYDSGSLEVGVDDLSPDGLRVLLQEEQVQRLEGIGELTCTLTLPGASEPITWQAQVVHLTPLAQGTALGAVFLITEAEAVGPQRRALANYCAARATAMARWSARSESA